MDEIRQEQEPVAESAEAAGGEAVERGEDYNTPLILIYGVIFAVIVFVSIVALSGLFHQMQRAEQRRKSESEQPQALLDLRSKQQQKLETYAWVDRQKGVVGIPIELAMQLVTAELAAQQQPVAAKPLAPAADGGAAGLQPQNQQAPGN